MEEGRGGVKQEVEKGVEEKVDEVMAERAEKWRKRG